MRCAPILAAIAATAALAGCADNEQADTTCRTLASDPARLHDFVDTVVADANEEQQRKESGRDPSLDVERADVEAIVRRLCASPRYAGDGKPYDAAVRAARDRADYD